MRGKDVGSSGIGVKNWLFGNEVSGVSIQTYDSGIRALGSYQLSLTKKIKRIRPSQKPSRLCGFA